MKIILVRHGQTQENVAGIIQSPESKLTELGVRQAETVAKKLKDEKIDKIYVSDLDRTKETAQRIIKLQPHAEVIYTKELREKNAGVFIGKPLQEQRKAREKSGLTFYDFIPEEGESLVAVQERMVNFYNQLLKKAEDSTVLLVTHQGPIITLLLYLFGKTFEEYGNYYMENTAMVDIEVRDGIKPSIKLSGFKN